MRAFQCPLVLAVFVSAVHPDGTAAQRAKHGVMVREMTGDGATRTVFQTPARFGMGDANSCE